MKAMWLILALAVISEAWGAAVAPEYVTADERYKADIQVIVAHGDDEVQVAGYLARAIFDEHRRVAVIFTARAEAGPSATGNEGGRTLGAEREIEARRALAHFGVENVWFIGGRHTNSHNVLTSLENMDHGSVVGEAVRLIRLTRPEVLITWLPSPVAGESHGDHQAASVIANEAFDLAGDPGAFAEQLYTQQPRDPAGHDAEGSQPWQPKKIYYYSDASDVPGWLPPPEPSPYRKNFVIGAGPSYSNTDVSPAKKVSYARLAAEENSFYLTAQEKGENVVAALARGDLKDFEFPVYFVLGKSLVPGHLTGDIFEGINPGPIAFAPPSRVSPPSQSDVSLESGGPWAFYRQWWRIHRLDGMAGLLPVPEFAVYPGQRVDIPLIIRNGTEKQERVVLNAVLPKGWTERREYSEFPLPAHSVYSVHSTLKASATLKSGWYELEWTAQADGQQIQSVKWRMHVTSTTASGTVPDVD